MDIVSVLSQGCLLIGTAIIVIYRSWHNARS